MRLVRNRQAENLGRGLTPSKKNNSHLSIEVTKCATMQPFDHLQRAFDNFFRELKKGKVAYPQFKKKKDNEGSFYIEADKIRLSETNKNSKALNRLAHKENGKHQYICMPNLHGGWVKMTKHIRFNYAKINNVCISQSGGKFYASFSLEITEEEYKRTHPNVDLVDADRKVGIDLGIKSALILSDGIAIDNPKPLKKNLRK